MKDFTFSPIAKMRSYRWMSAVVTGIVMTFVSGFFTALVFSAVIAGTAYLNNIRFFLPKMLCDGNGFPSAWAENLLPVGIMCFTALVFSIMGHGLAAFIIFAAAAADLMREKLNIVESLRKRLGK